MNLLNFFTFDFFAFIWVLTLSLKMEGSSWVIIIHNSISQNWYSFVIFQQKMIWVSRWYALFSTNNRPLIVYVLQERLWWVQLKFAFDSKFIWLRSYICKCISLFLTFNSVCTRHCLQDQGFLLCYSQINLAGKMERWSVTDLSDWTLLWETAEMHKTEDLIWARGEKKSCIFEYDFLRICFILCIFFLLYESSIK